MSTAENAEKRYLVENSIPELMDEFLLALVTDRPKDPRTYGTKWFETKSIEGSATELSTHANNGPAFTQYGLADRGSNVREGMCDATAHPDARFLIFNGQKPLSQLTSDGKREIAWVPSAAASPLISESTQVVFLGFDPQQTPHFTFVAAPETTASAIVSNADFDWDLRMGGGLTKTQTELGIMAQALSMLDWNARNLHCALCGAPNKSTEAGHKRVCTNADCKSHARVHNFCFPRTDPTAIMAVHDGGDSCLLGRSARFPPGLYSCLAGFVEPGETIEAAAAREVFEEAGVKLQYNTIKYQMSQPWPFPNSLMLGMIAQAEPNSVINIDKKELENAFWAPRADVVKALAAAAAGKKGPAEGLSFALPPPTTIAWQLLNLWVTKGAESKL
jgi:NAD+ diphosphatase